MQEEMQEHIERAAERFRARGMCESDALIAARREFGNVGVLQEAARDARGARWIETTVGDLRHAARQFARTPLLAGTIVVILTLGIGVAAAGFSVISGMLTRPAPGVPDDPALVAIRGIDIADGNRFPRSFSWPELQEYVALPQFADVAGWTTSSVVAEVGAAQPSAVLAQFVTPNFFATLGLRPAAGSFFGGDAGTRAPVEMSIVLGYSYAIEVFGAPANAIGKTIRVNGATAQVVGVGPPRFAGALRAESRRVVWMPVSAWPVVDRVGGNAFGDRATGHFDAIGRLKDGATAGRAMPALQLTAAQASRALLEAGGSGLRKNSVLTADAVPLQGDVGVYQGRGRAVELVAMVTALVTLILLVCATTVSSLLVGTAISRRHEIAVRLALGASRARIVKQLITETTLLAGIAGAAGLTVFALIARALRAQLYDVTIDPSWNTVIATAMFALLTSILCGLSPALHATRDGLSSVLNDSSRSATAKSRLQRAFVVAQMALTQPLLVGLVMSIGIVMREARHDARQSVGDFVLQAQFETWSAASQQENRMPSLVARYAALPGVLQVMPQVSGYMILRFEAPATGADAARQFSIRTHQVPPGYFKGMDIRLIRGREFVAADTTRGRTAVIIGADLAHRTFGQNDPIGKRFVTLTDDNRRMGEAEVVGVAAVDDVGPSEQGSQLRVYTPLNGDLGAGNRFDALLIRTSTPVEPLIPTFTEIARAEMPMTPIYSMKTLSEIDRERQGEVLEATTASALGGILTLLLASVGLYAVVARAVTQRRREIGVRISLGATTRQVVGLFFRNGVRVSVMGLLMGLPLSILAVKLLSARLGVPSISMPAVAGAVSLAVIIVASLASWIPARRAASVDPLTVLRDG
jgi:predicted permease